MKTIHNTYVVMESQEQCDRMKQLCIDNELPMWEDGVFVFNNKCGNQFYYTIDPDLEGVVYGFTVLYESEHETQITEQEFIELLEKQL